MTTTYTSTSLSPELDEAFEAGVEWARRSAGEHTLLVGGEHRPGGAGSTGRGAIRPRYVAQFPRERGHTVVGGAA